MIEIFFRVSSYFSFCARRSGKINRWLMIASEENSSRVYAWQTHISSASTYGSRGNQVSKLRDEDGSISRGIETQTFRQKIDFLLRLGRDQSCSRIIRCSFVAAVHRSPQYHNRTSFRNFRVKLTRDQLGTNSPLIYNGEDFVFEEAFVFLLFFLSFLYSNQLVGCQPQSQFSL